MRVFLTGGTGLIGSQLIEQLTARGYQIVLLTRREQAAREKFGATCSIIAGDPTVPGPWQDAVGNCDSVIHLAGRNVFDKRWSSAFKRELIESRVEGTRHVVEALKRSPVRSDGSPRVLVNASATGYYGPRGDEEVAEESAPGKGFLSDLCVQWESAARAVEASGVRCVVVRVGIVLDTDGGALAKLLLPFKMGVGGPVAGGRQWMSWIHRDDMVGIFLHAFENSEAKGPLNGTAPNPVTNGEFSRALGRALHRPAFVPTPGFALRLLLGEVSSVAIEGQKVLPKRTLALGYSYKYPILDAALTDLVGKGTNS